MLAVGFRFISRVHLFRRLRARPVSTTPTRVDHQAPLASLSPLATTAILRSATKYVSPWACRTSMLDCSSRLLSCPCVYVRYRTHRSLALLGLTILQLAPLRLPLVRTVLLAAMACIVQQEVLVTRYASVLGVSTSTVGVPVSSLLQTLCPTGYYCPNASLAIPCPAGTYNPTSGAVFQAQCLTCTLGNYCPAGSSANVRSLSGPHVRVDTCCTSQLCSLLSYFSTFCPPSDPHTVHTHQSGWLSRRLLLPQYDSCNSGMSCRPVRDYDRADQCTLLCCLPYRDILPRWSVDSSLSHILCVCLTTLPCPLPTPTPFT